MLRAKIRNFQSIESMDFTIQGLTVVTGQNNSGKSAIIRAIRGLFQNSRSAKQFVRHGTPQADVLLDLGDSTVRWEKSDKVNRYTVNGKVLDKVGSGVPPEVLDLGVQPVRVGDLTLWPQIADQFTGQVFLIDQPGSVIAEAISDTERVSKLNSALRSAESDRRSVLQTLKIRQSDLERADKRLTQFAGLDTVLEQVAVLDECTLSLEKRLKEIQEIKSLQTKWRLAILRCERLVSATLVKFPEPNAVASTRRDLLMLVGWSERASSLSKTLGGFTGFEKVHVPAIPSKPENLDWVSLAEMRLKTLRKDLLLRGVQVIVFPDPPKFVDLGGLSTMLARYRRVQNQVSSMMSLRSVQIPVEGCSVKARSDHLVLARWWDTLTQSRKDSADLLTAIESLQQQIDQVSTEIQDAVGMQCPVCGRTGGLNEDHLAH